LQALREPRVIAQAVPIRCHRQVNECRVVARDGLTGVERTHSPCAARAPYAMILTATAAPPEAPHYLRERTRVGLAHARENGKRLDRPATAVVHVAEIRKLHRAGVSKYVIDCRLEIGRTSVRRILGWTYFPLKYSSSTPMGENSPYGSINFERRAG